MHIQLENVTKTYALNDEEQVIIENINCSFEPGSFVTIMGKSGSGKSTLLRILGGLDLDFQGDVAYDGTSIQEMKKREQEKYIAQLRREKIGYVFQEYNLLENFTVYENLNIVLSLNKVPYQEREAKILAVLESVEMVEHKDKYPNQLSGGQQQRVGIARILLKDLSVIIADEPTGALDDKTGDVIMDLFKKFNEQGVTIIIATHAQSIFQAGKQKFKVEDGDLIEY